MDKPTATPATYYRTFAALIALLLLTIGAAQLPLGRLGAVMALSIAAAKALLIILFFMQIRYRNALARLVAAVGFSWLAILFALPLVDYLGRGWAHIRGK